MASSLSRSTKSELQDLVSRLRDRLEVAGVGEVRGPIEAATEARIDALELGGSLEGHGRLAIRLATMLDSGVELRSQAALSKEWRAVMAGLEAASSDASGSGDDEEDELGAEVVRLRGLSSG